MFKALFPHFPFSNLDFSERKLERDTLRLKFSVNFKLRSSTRYALSSTLSLLFMKLFFIFPHKFCMLLFFTIMDNKIINVASSSSHLDIVTLNLSYIPNVDLTKETHIISKTETNVDTNDYSTILSITPYYESIESGEESSVSPLHLPKINKHAPWEVSLAFFPN